MKNDSIDADRALLESLGFDDELIDSPSGTRMIRVLFGEDADDESPVDMFASADRGFACVA